MMNKKLVANVAVNIILLIIYIYCFGQHSVSKYLADGVIVVKYEEVSTNISPPGKSEIQNIIFRCEASLLVGVSVVRNEQF